MTQRISSSLRLMLGGVFTKMFDCCCTRRSGHAWSWSGISVLGRRAALVGLLMLVPGCGDTSTDTERPEPPPEDVGQADDRDFRILRTPAVVEQRLQIERVRPRVLERVVTAPGEVALDLRRVAKVTPRIEGQVEQVYVHLGDRVTKDQPLVAIGSLRLDELVQEYLVSKAQAEVAADNLRRIKKLRADQIIPERQLVEARGHHVESKTRYEHVREKLLNMALTEEDLRELEHGSHAEGHLYILKAPLRGRVVSQNVVLGQGVSPGVDLLEIVNTNQVWVFANLPIEEARRFKEGDTGAIVPKGGKPLEAPLDYVAPVADEKTRTVRVRFNVANPDGRLRPHEYVEVRLILEGAPTLAVPASAVTQVEGMRGVFVRRDAGYEFIPLQVGREAGDWIEVTRGLTAGDRVVTAGVFDLKSVLMKETIQAGD